MEALLPSLLNPPGQGTLRILSRLRIDGSWWWRKGDRRQPCGEGRLQRGRSCNGDERGVAEECGDLNRELGKQREGVVFGGCS